MNCTRALALVALAALALTAVPANAADTTTTFELTAGTLTISAPATANLGSAAAAAGTVSASLGTVQVTDDRGALTAAWDAKAVSTAFVTGTSPNQTTIPATSVTYTTGTGTVVSGSPVLVPVAVVADLSTAKTVMTATAVGSNAGSWAPTFAVTIPANAVAGTYSGTVTHSVS